MQKKTFLLGLSIILTGYLAYAATAVEVAKVNGKAITDQDIKALLARVPEAQRAELLKDQDRRRMLIAELVDQELLVQEGEKDKLDQSPEYKAAVVNFRRQYLASRVMEQSLRGKVTDQSARAYYNTRKTRYSTDEVQVQHILLSDEAKAREVLKLAQAKDADFMALAEKYSSDPSAKNNRGDLGFVTRDQFVPEFSEAAFTAKVPSVIGPVRTMYGFHVIKVVERKGGRQLGYDEIELKVKGDMQREYQRDVIGRIKKSAKITIDEKSLQKL